MTRTRLLLAAFTTALLAGCGASPQGEFNRGCDAMMKRQDDVNKEERQAFCGCLSEDTQELSDADKRTLGALMAESEDGRDFRIGLEEANEEGTVTPAGAATFFTAAKTCSLDLAI